MLLPVFYVIQPWLHRAPCGFLAPLRHDATNEAAIVLQSTRPDAVSFRFHPFITALEIQHLVVAGQARWAVGRWLCGLRAVFPGCTVKLPTEYTGSNYPVRFGPAWQLPELFQSGGIRHLKIVFEFLAYVGMIWRRSN